MSLSINCGGRLIDLSNPKVMGIINLTPDSFYVTSRKTITEDIIKQASKMIEDGADFIDIGAMSTRPGLEEISLEDEKTRLLNPFKILRKEFPNMIFSIDTYRSEIARIVLDEGADLINDISGGDFDNKMFETIAQYKTPYILMHTSDKPQNMQNKTQYDNILTDINQIFSNKLKYLYQLGAKDIILDLGFGFGKTIDQNYFLLKNLKFFSELRCPILVGISRKSMIYKYLNTSPENALAGSIALNMVALQNGAKILRVHDVLEAKHTIEIYLKLNSNLKLTASQ